MLLKSQKIRNNLSVYRVHKVTSKGDSRTSEHKDKRQYNMGTDHVEWINQNGHGP